jgi:hypothetical protein
MQEPEFESQTLDLFTFNVKFIVAKLLDKKIQEETQLITVSLLNVVALTLHMLFYRLLFPIFSFPILSNMAIYTVHSLGVFHSNPKIFHLLQLI